MAWMWLQGKVRASTLAPETSSRRPLLWRDKFVTGPVVKPETGGWIPRKVTRVEWKCFGRNGFCANVL